MLDLVNFINESQVEMIINEMTNNEYQNLLSKQQYERIDDVLKTKYKNLTEFFNNLKSFKGSEYQCPMRKNSIFICMGDNYWDADDFNHYDNIFIQLNSPKERYAIYLDDDKIAICKDVKISYSGNSKNKASFLQNDGTYGKITSKMTFLDQSSETVKNELEKFKL